MENDFRKGLHLLRDERVWKALNAPPAPGGRLGANAQVILEEKEAAIAQLEDILTGPRAWWPQRLRRTHGAMTAGMVLQLLRQVATVGQQCPEDALQLTSMAMMVAEELEVDDYSEGMVLRVRAQALRDHGGLLAFVHRHAEALEFLERAERAFEDVPFNHYDLARLALGKAGALRLHRPAEAAAAARDAARTFLLFHDRSRYVKARITEAACTFEGGAVEEAMDIWQSLESEPEVDDALRVMLAHNIALCLVQLGRGVEAIPPLEHCLAEFERLGLATEQVRARWHLGTALLATPPRRHEAILALRTAWQAFGKLRMRVDAALAALDLADALLLDGQPEEVPTICDEAIAHLTQAGLTEDAYPALTHLREAAAQGEASRALIRDTYEWIKRAAREERLFAGVG